MAHELTLNKLTGLVEMGYAPGTERWPTPGGGMATP
jgi:hypothetical protein